MPKTEASLDELSQATLVVALAAHGVTDLSVELAASSETFRGFLLSLISSQEMGRRLSSLERAMAERSRLLYLMGTREPSDTLTPKTSSTGPSENLPTYTQTTLPDV